jgi:predicted HicB family RNase H-like nuclease
LHGGEGGGSNLADTKFQRCRAVYTAVLHTNYEEKTMKNEKTKLGTKEQIDDIDEHVNDKSAALKKKKKTKQVVEIPTEVPKVKKTKSEKGQKKVVEPKDQKAPKEDKLTKFLVSMKKSVRKSIKKEAAEAGVSMNEFIVLAVEKKLSQD